jgi:hypothetical protein
MDGMRLTDVQKHRLASQNEDCHSKKTLLGASLGTARGAKRKLFCEDTGIHVFSEVFRLLWSLLGSTDELFSFVMVI